MCAHESAVRYASSSDVVTCMLAAVLLSMLLSDEECTSEVVHRCCLHSVPGPSQSSFARFVAGGSL